MEEEAELVRQALLEQERWEAEATGQLHPEEVWEHRQLDDRDAYDDPYKQQLIAAAALKEAVPPVRASELSARLAHGSDVAAKAAAEIAARLASARSHARSAHAADDAAKKRSEKTMAGLKDRADSAKADALAAVAAHERAAAEVHRASEELDNARMLVDAAAEVLELAKDDAAATRAAAPEILDPEISPDELAQLELDVAHSTAATLASKAAHEQAESAAARGADELRRLYTVAERATQLGFDAEDDKMHALQNHREGLEATLAKLRGQVKQFEELRAAEREAGERPQRAGVSDRTRECEATYARAKGAAMKSRAKAADLASLLADAKEVAGRLKAAADAVDSPDTVRAQGESYVSELQADVEQHKSKIAGLLASVERAKCKADAAQRDLENAKTTARELADAAAVDHQEAITAHETAHQRARSVRRQLTSLEEEQAHAGAATLLAKSRLQAARERATTCGIAADEVEHLRSAASAARQDADQASERATAARERLTAAELNESSCQAAAEAVTDDAAARRLKSAASTEDDMTVQSLRTACVAADQFLQIRKSRLESAEDEVRLLETSLQEARQAFAALTARAHSPRTEQAEKNAARRQKEALRAEKLAELKEHQAKRTADAVLQFLGDSETVTLEIQYNTFYGKYNEQHMMERLLRIGAPEDMARGVSSWLKQGAAEIKGPLHKARAIMGQLQAVQSLKVCIVQTPKQIASGMLQAQQAGVDFRGVPSAEELALEREVSNDEDNDDSVDTNALLEIDLVSGTKHSLMEKAQKARLEHIDADRAAADAAAASSAAKWGAAASAYHDQHSPKLAHHAIDEDPTALVNRMSHIQTELDGAKRLAKLARQEFAEYKVKHAAAHDNLDAAVRDKELALEDEMASARARVMAANVELENAVQEVAAARHALTEAVEQQTTCNDVQRLAEAEATAAQGKLDSATTTGKEVAEAESAVATCTSRFETLGLQAAEMSATFANAEQAEQQFARKEQVCLVHRVSAEIVGQSVVDEVQRIVDETAAELQSAQRAVEIADAALGKATDEYNVAVAQVEAEVSEAVLFTDQRQEAVAAQQKVDVLRAFLAMTVVWSEKRSAAADIAEEEYALASELEEKELAALDKRSEATAEAVRKHSDSLLLLRDEIAATEQKIAECLERESAGTAHESDRSELDTIRQALSAAEAEQRELEHQASEAAEHAAAAEQTLMDRKAQLQARQTQQESSVLAGAEQKKRRAEDMLNTELARVQAEQERLVAAEAAEASALQHATLKKAEASRTAESALAELARTREATALASHDCQIADEAVVRLESALKEAQALARAAKANEDEARALAIASPGASRDGAATVSDDSWADLTVYKSADAYGATTHYVHRTNSGGTTLRLSSPPREGLPARKTTVSFGPDRFDDEGPPAPKWVPASTGGGNPDYGLVSTHVHATGSARSAAADRAAMDASALRPPSPELAYRPATRAELHAENLSKANPWSEPRTVHQKGHHLNRAYRSPTKRRASSKAASKSDREAEREQTFQRLSSPSRARHAGVSSGSFSHPKDYAGDTHGHTFSEAMARQHSTFKRRPAAPPPATGATMRLHKNEESLYELKDRIAERSQPRYMDAVADSMMRGQQAAQDRERRRAAAEAQKVADELAAEEALKVKAQAVAAATLKGKRNLGLTRQKSRKSSGSIWERTEEQLERRKKLLEKQRKKEQHSQEQLESQVKWGADIGRLWACVNVLYEQLKLATALFEQVKYEVRTGQDQSGAASPRSETRLQEAFADICDQNAAELTLSVEQRDGLFGVLNSRDWLGDDQEEQHQDVHAVRRAQQEAERDAFYQLCCHHPGLSLSPEKCDKLLALVLANQQQDSVVTMLTATFEEGREWGATVNKMAASTHTATQRRWKEWEHKRNARIEDAKRRQEEATAATLRETPELKNSFAKRTQSPVGGRAAVKDRIAAESTESSERTQSAARRKATRVPKTTKKRPWEIQGYRGASVERVGRSQTPQRRPLAPSPPRVYGVHTQISEEKSTKGALEAELLRQAEWRERAVPDLSRSFAAVVSNDSVDADDATVVRAADASGEGSPTLSVASSVTVHDSSHNMIPPESQLPKSVAQLVVRLRSLSYGTSGQDPVKLFRHFDRKNRGGLDQREFGLAVRKGGALTRSQMSDTELRLLFEAVDKDSDGFISMSELRDFVWGGEEIEAATVESVESRRHKSAAALPLTVGTFAPASSLTEGATSIRASGQSSNVGSRSATPKRRVGSPKPLHERRTISSRERWLTLEEQQERERAHRETAAPDLSKSKQSFETRFAPAERQRKAEAARRGDRSQKASRGRTPVRDR